MSALDSDHPLAIKESGAERIATPRRRISLTKVTIEITGKQVDTLLALALEHNKTICGMVHEIIAEYLGEPREGKPIRKAKDKGGRQKFSGKQKTPARRRKWESEGE